MGEFDPEPPFMIAPPGEPLRRKAVLRVGAAS